MTWWDLGCRKSSCEPERVSGMVGDDCELEGRKNDLCTQWYPDIHLTCVEIESAVYSRKGCTVVIQA